MEIQAELKKKSKQIITIEQGSLMSSPTSNIMTLTQRRNPDYSAHCNEDVWHSNWFIFVRATLSGMARQVHGFIGARIGP